MTSTKTHTPLISTLTLCLFLTFSHFSFSQTKIDSLLGKLDPQKFASSIAQKSQKLEQKLIAKSLKVLENMRRQEERIYKKMLKGKDSLIAKAELQSITAKYEEKIKMLKSAAPSGAIGKARQYIPRLDSLNTSLKFLNESGIGGKVKDAIARTDMLKDKFQQAEEIKNFIKKRREQLKAQLEKIGLVKDLKKINKQVYYYANQVQEYKEILKDPKKIEKKALELLAKNKWFQGFMKKHSMLAQLFRMPGDPADPAYLASLSGLQTRSQVNGLIQQQIQSAGPSGRQQFQQQMQNAQSQLNQLKSKLGKLGGGSSDDIIPEGFKPNEQKTKSFLQRLELGTNVQTQSASSYFPTTTDVGLNVGYKLNDKSIIGIGASYKMGLGRGWNAIRFTSEGVGLRSYIDWKIKGSLWISGGYEMNYKTAFSDFDQLRDMSGWQRSGLLGISKSIPVKSKFFKKTKVQVLWDFLSYEQRPRSQPFVFRVGYNFK